MKTVFGRIAWWSGDVGVALLVLTILLRSNDLAESLLSNAAVSALTITATAICVDAYSSKVDRDQRDPAAKPAKDHAIRLMDQLAAFGDRTLFGAKPLDQLKAILKDEGREYQGKILAKLAERKVQAADFSKVTWGTVEYFRSEVEKIVHQLEDIFKLRGWALDVETRSRLLEMHEGLQEALTVLNAATVVTDQLPSYAKRVIEPEGAELVVMAFEQMQPSFRIAVELSKQPE